MNQLKNNLKDLLEKDESSITDPASIEPKPAPKSQQSDARRDKKLVSGHFDKDTHHQLLVLKLETGKSIQVLLGEALNALFTIYNKPPIAK